MNKINIRCCSRTAEKLFNIHFCDYATITMFRYCFVMLISKHDIIVKQSKFAREPLSRLLKIIVVKILTALKSYTLHIAKIEIFIINLKISSNSNIKYNFRF